MDGRTPGVTRDRPDFVRRGERCWIDGDLIRLSAWPIGGIRPGGRAGPIPWLMDLSVLEEAMQEVYGRSFRLGDRAPLLQAAANALAAGNRRRAAEIADAVAFPPPEYASRLRNAGLRYLNWGPAHRRGNPPIDVEAWLDRLDWERKFDPDQPRVPRGHPDGGQWTDGGWPEGGGNRGDESEERDDEAENPGDRLLTDEEYETFLKVQEEVRSVLAESGDPRFLTVLTAAPFGRRPGILKAIQEWGEPIATALVELLQEGRLYRFMTLWKLVETFAPELFGYMEEAEEWEEIKAEEEYHGFYSSEAFEEKYKRIKKPLRDWHHIVERKAVVEPGSMGKPDQLHSTDNMVQIPRAKHWAITKYYGDTDPDDPRFVDISPRDWLRGQPWQVQYDFGIEMLRKFRALKE